MGVVRRRIVEEWYEESDEVETDEDCCDESDEADAVIDPQAQQQQKVQPKVLGQAAANWPTSRSSK